MALSGRAKFNWVACLTLLALCLGIVAWWLRESNALMSGSSAEERVTNVPLLVFHAFLAVSWTLVLLLIALEPNPMETRYCVMGHPEIPMAGYDFNHLGRWTTFTLWCNTIANAYFWLAAVSDACLLRHPGMAVPQPVTTALLFTWGIIMPTAFLVNLVVTFTLIPMIKKLGSFEKMDGILSWKAVWCHNGFALATAAEAALASPVAAVQNFPIVLLFCSAYCLFAYLLFFGTGIYHYFFMDPRFKHSPVAMLILMLLLASLYMGGCLVVQAAAGNSLLGGLIVAAALGTCTWRSPPGETLDGLGTVAYVLRFCGRGRVAQASSKALLAESATEG